MISPNQTHCPALQKLALPTAAESVHSFDLSQIALPEGNRVRNGEDDQSPDRASKILDEIDLAVGSRPIAVTDLEVYARGPRAFLELEERIDRAHTHVRLKLFSWAPDSTGQRLAEVLVEKRRSNPSMEIEVTVDLLGTLLVGSKREFVSRALPLLPKFCWKLWRYGFDFSDFSVLLSMRRDVTNVYRLSPEKQQALEKTVAEVLDEALLFRCNRALRTMRDGGVTLRVEKNFLSTLEHSKVCEVDGAMLIGGMNVGDEYSGGYESGKGWTARVRFWRDYMFRFIPKAKEIWRELTDRAAGRTEGSVLGEESQDSSVRILRNDNVRVSEDPFKMPKRKQISFALQRLFEWAEHSIHIQHAYLMSHKVTQWLCDAADRGVAVTIQRGQPEEPAIEAANEKFFKVLEAYRPKSEKGKIEILRSQFVIHGKSILLDDQILVGGSANLDDASLERNGEVAIILREGDSSFAKLKARLKGLAEQARRRYQRPKRGDAAR